ncbi:MAG: hypothetical protein EOO68_26725, partial [Moraxellaceae bacterium]
MIEGVMQQGLAVINPQQLERTLMASNYAQQVMQQQPQAWQADYAQDQFLVPLSSVYIQNLVQQALSGDITEQAWMQAARQLRARLMLRW